MKSPEENKRKFDAEQQIRFVQDREELIDFVRDLCAASNLGKDFVDSFIVRLEKTNEDNFFDGVDVNALD